MPAASRYASTYFSALWWAGTLEASRCQDLFFVSGSVRGVKLLFSEASRCRAFIFVQVSRFAAAWFAAAVLGFPPQPRADLVPSAAFATDTARGSAHSGFQTTFLLFVWNGPTHDHPASSAHASRSPARGSR
jgi:hypothetical protein